MINTLSELVVVGAAMAAIMGAIIGLMTSNTSLFVKSRHRAEHRQAAEASLLGRLEHVSRTNDVLKRMLEQQVSIVDRLSREVKDLGGQVNTLKSSRSEKPGGNSPRPEGASR